MTDRAKTRTEEQGEVDRKRRDFLRAAGVTGAAAAAAVTVAPGEASAQEFPPDEPVRYELTPHIERFYFLNRL